MNRTFRFRKRAYAKLNLRFRYPGRFVRADARRNRELITAAAVSVFAERGPGASMEDVARAAGVGVGTLYRHFPDRQALLDDTAVDTLRRLLAAAREFVGRPVPRWEVLALIAGHCAGLPLAMAKSLPRDAPGRSAAGPLVRSLDALLEQIAAQAQHEGSIRSDITPRDVVDLLSTAVCRPGARPGDALTTVILDGLKPATARNRPSPATSDNIPSGALLDDNGPVTW
jgi:AcrR family transcriptional regulator